MSADENSRQGIEERSSILRLEYYGMQAREIPSNDFAMTMVKVVQYSFGLDKAALFKETALYGYGWGRQGEVIKNKLESAYRSLLRKKLIRVGSDKQIELTE